MQSVQALTALLQERQQLSLLERERQAAVRQHEDELAAEMQRLDDVSKEQRLNQMQVMERAYQTQLQVASSTKSCILALICLSFFQVICLPAHLPCLPNCLACSFALPARPSCLQPNELHTLALML